MDVLVRPGESDIYSMSIEELQDRYPMGYPDEWNDWDTIEQFLVVKNDFVLSADGSEYTPDAYIISIVDGNGDRTNNFVHQDTLHVTLDYVNDMTLLLIYDISAFDGDEDDLSFRYGSSDLIRLKDS